MERRLYKLFFLFRVFFGESLFVLGVAMISDNAVIDIIVRLAASYRERVKELLC